MNRIRCKNFLRIFMVFFCTVSFGLIVTAFLNNLTSSLFLSMIFGSIVTLGSYVYLGLKYELNKFGKAVILPQAISASLVVLLFLLTVPLNVDRSISVWLLARVTNSHQLSKVDLQKHAVFFFENTSDEVDRRINEQIQIKNLKLNASGSYELTAQGEWMSTFFRLVANFFGLQKKYANGD